MLRKIKPKYQTTQGIPFPLENLFHGFYSSFLSTTVKQPDMAMHNPINHTRGTVSSFVWTKVSFNEVFPFSVNWLFTVS